MPLTITTGGPCPATMTWARPSTVGASTKSSRAATPEFLRAAVLMYAVAHLDTWRALTDQLRWTDDHYVEAMSRLLRRSLLAT